MIGDILVYTILPCIAAYFLGRAHELFRKERK